MGTSDIQAGLAEAVEWFVTVSCKRCRIDVHPLPAVEISRPLGYYTVAGGKGPPPNNSQGLAQEALCALGNRGIDNLARAGGALLMIVPGPVKPHTWHLPNGGKSLGNGSWCRRYAVVPAGATLGAIVHELGHLLFDWPDLDWEPSLGRDCLMARGGLRRGGRHPAPPCAPLLVAAGWRNPIPIDKQLPVNAISVPVVGRVVWNDRDVLVERRTGADGSCLLVYETRTTAAGIHPRIIGRFRVTAEHETQKVLGIIAPALRKRGLNG